MACKLGFGRCEIERPTVLWEIRVEVIPNDTNWEGDDNAYDVKLLPNGTAHYTVEICVRSCLEIFTKHASHGGCRIKDGDPFAMIDFCVFVFVSGE